MLKIRFCYSLNVFYFEVKLRFSGGTKWTEADTRQGAKWSIWTRQTGTSRRVDVANYTVRGFNTCRLNQIKSVCLREDEMTEKRERNKWTTWETQP
jgi:hypothetical protein